MEILVNLKNAKIFRRYIFHKKSKKASFEGHFNIKF